MKALLKRRPAESGTAAFAVAVLIGRALGLDAETTGYLAVAIGAAPGAITFLVDQYRRARAEGEE